MKRTPFVSDPPDNRFAAVAVLTQEIKQIAEEKRAADLAIGQTRSQIMLERAAWAVRANEDESADNRVRYIASAPPSDEEVEKERVKRNPYVNFTTVKVLKATHGADRVSEAIASKTLPVKIVGSASVARKTDVERWLSGAPPQLESPEERLAARRKRYAEWHAKIQRPNDEAAS